MAKIGVGGLVCGILGMVMGIMIFVFPMIMISLALSLNISGLMVIIYLWLAFMFAGPILSVIGLILGIVGAAKDEVKAPGIVGIVFSAIGIGIGLFFLIPVLTLPGGLLEWLANMLAIYI